MFVTDDLSSRISVLGRGCAKLLVVRQRDRSRDADLRSDVELLAATRAGAEAFTEFYQRHFDGIIGYFWSRTRDRDHAAELTAETFAAALEGLDRFDPDRGNPSQWLYGIARNQLRTFWRRNKASAKARTRLGIRTPKTPTTGWADIEAADARLDAGRLSEALQRVPVGNREAVQLRVIDELDYDEIGLRLGIKAGAARVRVHRGLQRLENEFDQAARIEVDP